LKALKNVKRGIKRTGEYYTDVTRDKLSLKNVYEVHNYMEAAVVIQALRKGISIGSLHRPLETLRMVESG
jgi:hypothetical protein